ncbi:MAG TPA: hypothetical protein VFA46_09970 [Actinomycetes bacterium]|nr:hypothetical protein [Actinomycetes bacterium]
MRKALIVGEGVAGPVAAMALQRAGIDVVVYEAYVPSGEEVGSYLTVASNGLDALRAIGAEAPVRAAGFPTPPTCCGAAAAGGWGGVQRRAAGGNWPRTPWCWPSACATSPTSPRRWPPTSGYAAGGWNASSPRARAPAAPRPLDPSAACYAT